jgi:hypothetical protein
LLPGQWNSRLAENNVDAVADDAADTFAVADLVRMSFMVVDGDPAAGIGIAAHGLDVKGRLPYAGVVDAVPVKKDHCDDAYARRADHHGQIAWFHSIPLNTAQRIMGATGPSERFSRGYRQIRTTL